jgi:hypothetical protein
MQVSGACIALSAVLVAVVSVHPLIITCDVLVLVVVTVLFVVPHTIIASSGITRPFALAHRHLAWNEIVGISSGELLRPGLVLANLPRNRRAVLVAVPHAAIPELRWLIDSHPARHQPGNQD